MLAIGLTHPTAMQRIWDARAEPPLPMPGAVGLQSKSEHQRCEHPSSKTRPRRRPRQHERAPPRRCHRAQAPRRARGSSERLANALETWVTLWHVVRPLIRVCSDQSDSILAHVRLPDTTNGGRLASTGRPDAASHGVANAVGRRRSLDHRSAGGVLQQRGAQFVPP